MGLAISGNQVKAQSYPADPTIAQIITDIKKDPASKKMMTSYGYNPDDIAKSQYRFAKKSELKDYFYEKWYGRSDYAYKISQNEYYMDTRYFSVFMTTPKDAQGVSHQIFFKVTYSRRTDQNFEDNKWSYKWLFLDPRENETYGLPKITDDERKKIMIDYIEKNGDSDQTLSEKYNMIRKIIKIDSVFAYNDTRNFKPTGAGKFLWTLTIRAEYVHDADQDGGVEVTREGYISIKMEAGYKNGGYAINSVINTGENFDTHAPGWKKMYADGLSHNKNFEDHLWFSTLAEVGFDAITGKSIQNEQPKGSKAFLEKRLVYMVEALKTLDSNDPEKIRKALMPIMNPSNAKNLTESYITLVQDFRDKMCEIKVIRVADGIDYNFELGDKEGAEIDFSMTISRESARSSELKKKYKSAGMSNTVLKSTRRNEEYGMVTNTSYRTTFKITLIGDNWYIDEMANLEKTKVAF